MSFLTFVIIFCSELTAQVTTVEAEVEAILSLVILDEKK